MECHQRHQIGFPEFTQILQKKKHATSTRCPSVPGKQPWLFLLHLVCDTPRTYFLRPRIDHNMHYAFGVLQVTQN